MPKDITYDPHKPIDTPNQHFPKWYQEAEQQGAMELAQSIEDDINFDVMTYQYRKDDKEAGIKENTDFIVPLNKDENN